MMHRGERNENLFLMKKVVNSLIEEIHFIFGEVSYTYVCVCVCNKSSMRFGKSECEMLFVQYKHTHITCMHICDMLFVMQHSAMYARTNVAIVIEYNFA